MSRRVVVVSADAPADALEHLVASIRAWPGLSAEWEDPARRTLRIEGGDLMVDSVISAGERAGHFVTPQTAEA